MEGMRIGSAHARRWSRRALALTATVALQLGLVTVTAAASPEAFVRVNQIGYEVGAPKRAYVLSTLNETGAPFTVLAQDGHVTLRGVVGASLGKWSRRAGAAYALDFDSLRTPGKYTIALGGPAAATSPPFVVASAQALYSAPLARALTFYENERDGPEFIPSALRTAPGHLNDEHAMTYLTPKVNEEGAFAGELESLGETIDAAGGWWDAGDYLKFVQTTSYAVSLQLVGVRDFPAQMGDEAGASDFTDEARFGVEWLLRMWNDKTRTLYYQVGIGTGNSKTLGDHDIWRLPQEDDTYGGENPRFRFIRHRPVFRAGPPDSPVSPNLAGRDAAAFALCYQVFARSDPALASRCLLAGEHIFALADTHPRGHLLTTIPYDFYPETEWRDDLELGATELALALADGGTLPAGLPHTRPLFYLEAAASWARTYILHSGAQGEGLNLYDVSGLADFELVRAIREQGQPVGLAVTEPDLIADLAHKLAVATAQAQSDPFGFGFPWDAADSVSHGDGLSVMASEYDDLTGEQPYATYAERWLGNMLGANAWGSSFIVGDGSVFPHCLQHQVANIVGSLDGSPPVLAGAVVEGPTNEHSGGFLTGMRRCPPEGGDPFRRFNNRAIYKDNVVSYTTTEPAIDLTASSMLAFSWQIEPAVPLPQAAPPLEGLSAAALLGA
jgi:endoglucanase